MKIKKNKTSIIKFLVVVALLNIFNQGFSSDILNNMIDKSDSENSIAKTLNRSISLEDFVLYQIYTETKCEHWLDTVKLPVTCLKKFPVKHKGKYVLKSRLGVTWDEKEVINRFAQLDEKAKIRYVKNESKYLRERIKRLIDEIYIPDHVLSEYSTQQIKEKINNKIILEINFTYGDGMRYFVKYIDDKNIEVKSSNNGIIAL